MIAVSKDPDDIDFVVMFDEGSNLLYHPVTKSLFDMQTGHYV